jgi:hypothetical protein
MAVGFSAEPAPAVSRGAWAGRRHPLQASCRRHGRDWLSTWVRGNYRESLSDRIYRYKKCAYGSDRTRPLVPLERAYGSDRTNLWK